jgi:hypothetical protein
MQQTLGSRAQAFYGYILLLICTLSGFFTACGDQSNSKRVYRAAGRTVEIVGQNGQYTLLRNGEPYFIKGAGGYDHYQRIKENGGNSVRVWHADNAQQVLDEAHRHGLTVTLGLWMGREKEGFNYYDKDMVARQLEDFRKVVLRYKDHPALLMWGVGNEVNVGGTSTKVWDAVNEIAEMIHQVDPDHPTTTMLIGVREKTVNLIIKKCPAIDVLSFNIFGALHDIQDKINETNWEGPYLISEFGARGYWETYTTGWYAPLEQTSSEKAAYIEERYRRVVLSDTARCLGGYLFYWGYKQEGTPTWFSTMLETGEETETVGLMRKLWMGDSTGNKVPYVAYVKLDDTFAHENLYLHTQQEVTAALYSFDPDGDSLRYVWEVLPETVDQQGSSTTETKPDPIPGLLGNARGNKVQVLAPKKTGPYRLFAYVYDGQGHVATANIPFFVYDSTTTASRW